MFLLNKSMVVRTNIEQCWVRNRKVIFWILLFIVFILLNSYFPMTSDDLYLKYYFEVDVTDIKDLFLKTIYRRNGRLLGNSGILILVRYPIVKVIWKSIIMTALPYLFIKFFNIKSVYAKILGIILLLYPSAQMFAQVYVWTAGFQNYLPPMVLLLLSLLIYKRQWEKATRVNCILLFVIGIAQTLYLETATLVIIEIAIGLAIYTFKFKRKNIGAYVYLLGTLCGGGIIFFLPHLVNPGADKDGYYNIGGASLYAVYHQMIQHAEKYVQTISSCVLMICVLSVLIVVPMIKDGQCLKFKNDMFNVGVLVTYPIYSILNVSFVKQWVYSGGWSTYLTLIWFSVYLVSIIRGIMKYYFTQRDMCLILLALSLLSFAPLLITSMVRERNCYISYLCMVGIVLVLVDESPILKRISVPSCNLIFGTVLISLIITLVMVCADWNYVSKTREKYLRRLADKGATFILLPALPHEQLLQADDSPAYWKYYTDAEFGYDIQIEFCDWYSWLVNKEQPE